jgi:hypothetical protein
MSLDIIVSALALVFMLSVAIPLVMQVSEQVASWPRRPRLLVMLAQLVTLPTLFLAVGFYV